MARKIGKPAEPTSVEAVHHTGDSRVNIPTAETQSLVAKEEQGPQTLRYPRDPSLDPQLVWKGKDEQDGEDLVVPAIPIYIQEQISPKAIIEDLRATTAAGRDSQLDLFSGDFNGAVHRSVDIYRPRRGLDGGEGSELQTKEAASRATGTHKWHSARLVPS